jgi:hypothetical protein
MNSLTSYTFCLYYGDEIMKGEMSRRYMKYKKILP